MTEEPQLPPREIRMPGNWLLFWLMLFSSPVAMAVVISFASGELTPFLSILPAVLALLGAVYGGFWISNRIAARAEKPDGTRFIVMGVVFSLPFYGLCFILSYGGCIAGAFLSNTIRLQMH